MPSTRAARLAATGSGALALLFLPATVSHLFVPHVDSSAERSFLGPRASVAALADLTHVPQPLLLSGRIADLPVPPIAAGGNALDAIGANLRPASIDAHPASISAPRVEASLAPSGLLAYAPGLDDSGGGNPLLMQPPAIEVDTTGVREAIAAYRSGDAANGDLHAARTTNALARTAVDLVAVKQAPRLERIQSFLTARPDWPAASSLRRRAEEALFVDRRPGRQAIEAFAARKPETPTGKLALARAQIAAGRTSEAAELVRSVWRENDLSASLETSIRQEFGEHLTRADHKFRSDRFAYKENASASLRVAAYGGPDVLAIARAREGLKEKLIAALPADAKKDPTIVFARIQKLRRDNKIAEATALMLSAPRDPAVLVHPDEWWVERRVLTRKALDMGDPKAAYRLSAEHSAVKNEYRIEAEFHAGWIALRFLDDAALAEKHFANCAGFAETPMSIARAAYWRGRAAEALGRKDDATAHFQTAASHSTAYYGQLARARLGRTDLEMRRPARVARGDERQMAVRVVELLLALDQKDIAGPLAAEIARTLDDEAQIAALAEVMTRAGDAGATLNIGKIASQRGFALDEPAYPTFGIPPFEPLARSAEKPMVYAIARQESAFATKALSSAGAKGLMQMITSTARSTANRAGVAFDENRLINDPAFNAQLGAAHLADLLGEYRNSHILTFAAYNAGGKRVREWINAYGDPRDLNIDPIDWIERIPFAETRNYVQRIVENLEIYRVRMGERRELAIERTLRHAEARR